MNNLLERVRAGFNTLHVAKKYSEAALKALRTWLTESMFEDYVSQIIYLIETERWDVLLDSFYQEIPFGTGGRRGLVGIGPNRINIWTIQASAQGHSQYLTKQHGDEAKERGVVLAYDVRKYAQKGVYDENRPNPVMNLDCRRLAVAAAEVYGANGINVLMFDGVRSTPELSFAIRYFKAVSGDMFSASHNLPTDNGKKVYDEFGGQLIPPYDQHLVDEVAGNVKEIKSLDFDEARRKGLVRLLSGEEVRRVDEAYFEAVCGVSLSDARGLKVFYSPLHGTGLTTLYPVLERLGFEVVLDPETSNMSGAFENVTFNIPNPEVIESFDTSLPHAGECGADLILSTDPDADRIGAMVRHNKEWEFLNGNEIGLILTRYGISRYKAKGLLDKDCVVVKTMVTTSLIEKIARKSGVRCVADLLVGFKYIAHEMNKLEEAGAMGKFILGVEESHGIIIGNYARDKDAACAGLWLAELAASLKKDGMTLVDYLDRVYAEYGYCHNYLTEIRLTGSRGIEQISRLMDCLRTHRVEGFGEFAVEQKIDRWEGEPFLSETDRSSRNMLIFKLKDLPATQGVKVTVRPSGTEPKVKMYFELCGKPFDLSALEGEKEKLVTLRKELEEALMLYCYKILGVDFPPRGFLLFWQLPLSDKLRYFEVEGEIAALKEIQDKETREQKLGEILGFLGADPLEKVDKAFAAKYGRGVLDYLGL